jgi:hypothetical protein
MATVDNLKAAVAGESQQTANTPLLPKKLRKKAIPQSLKCSGRLQKRKRSMLYLK